MHNDNAADLVLINGAIYTADGNDTVCEAVAVKGSQIIFTGSAAAVRPLIGRQTSIIDLKGKMVVPGFIDTHIHPPGLALVDLYEVQLSHSHTLAEYIGAIREYLARYPEAKAVYGRGWSWGAFTGAEVVKGPRKQHLDAICSDKPVVLRAADGHTLWVNSKALEVNGISRETPAPAGGVIEKDPASGELWGTLKESAMSLIALPAYTTEQYTKAMAAFQQKMHSYGITGVLCLGSLTFASLFRALGRLDQDGELKLRVRGAMTVHPQEDLAAQFDAIGELKRQFASENLQVTSVKFFTDGVVEGGTSFLLEPYTDKLGRGTEFRGEFLWNYQRLVDAFGMANRRGLQLHVHSTGDASTRLVLDALEQARIVAGEEDYRNIITHLQLVDKTDIPRFRQLGVIASVQPYWHYKLPNWWETVDYQFLGQRAETEFPLGSFFKNGVTVTSSSDYPATIVPNPLHAIEIGVTRNLENGAAYGLADITNMDDERYLLNKEERATLLEMLRSFTINGAYALHMEQLTGSIEPGKRADLVVLDRNLLKLNPLDIDQVNVVMTFFDGKLVYELPSGDREEGSVS